MIRFLCLLLTLQCSFGWACSFHSLGADVFFEQSSTALNKKSEVDLSAFVGKANKYHYIDSVQIVAYTGDDLVPVDRLNDLANARGELIKLAVSEIKVDPKRVFVESRLPAKNRFLSPQPDENAKVAITIHGWRSAPILCGLCPCFEKE
jgi:hypothetical protein